MKAILVALVVALLAVSVYADGNTFINPTPAKASFAYFRSLGYVECAKEWGHCTCPGGRVAFGADWNISVAKKDILPDTFLCSTDLVGVKARKPNLKVMKKENRKADNLAKVLAQQQIANAAANGRQSSLAAQPITTQQKVKLAKYRKDMALYKKQQAELARLKQKRKDQLAKELAKSKKAEKILPGDTPTVISLKKKLKAERKKAQIKLAEKNHALTKASDDAFRGTVDKHLRRMQGLKEKLKSADAMSGNELRKAIKKFMRPAESASQEQILHPVGIPMVEGAHPELEAHPHKGDASGGFSQKIVQDPVTGELVADYTPSVGYVKPSPHHKKHHKKHHHYNNYRSMENDESIFLQESESIDEAGRPCGPPHKRPCHVNRHKEKKPCHGKHCNRGKPCHGKHCNRAGHPGKSCHGKHCKRRGGNKHIDDKIAEMAKNMVAPVRPRMGVPVYNNIKSNIAGQVCMCQPAKVIAAEKDLTETHAREMEDKLARAIKQEKTMKTSLAVLKQKKRGLTKIVQLAIADAKVAKKSVHIFKHEVKRTQRKLHRVHKKAKKLFKKLERVHEKVADRKSKAENVAAAILKAAEAKKRKKAAFKAAKAKAASMAEKSLHRYSEVAKLQQEGAAASIIRAAKDEAELFSKRAAKAVERARKKKEEHRLVKEKARVLEVKKARYESKIAAEKIKDALRRKRVEKYLRKQQLAKDKVEFAKKKAQTAKKQLKDSKKAVRRATQKRAHVKEAIQAAKTQYAVAMQKETKLEVQKTELAVAYDCCMQSWCNKFMNRALSGGAWRDDSRFSAFEYNSVCEGGDKGIPAAFRKDVSVFCDTEPKLRAILTIMTSRDRKNISRNTKCALHLVPNAHMEELHKVITSEDKRVENLVKRAKKFDGGIDKFKKRVRKTEEQKRLVMKELKKKKLELVQSHLALRTTKKDARKVAVHFKVAMVKKNGHESVVSIHKDFYKKAHYKVSLQKDKIKELEAMKASASKVRAAKKKLERLRHDKKNLKTEYRNTKERIELHNQKIAAHGLKAREFHDKIGQLREQKKAVKQTYKEAAQKVVEMRLAIAREDAEEDIDEAEEKVTVEKATNAVMRTKKAEKKMVSSIVRGVREETDDCDGDHAWKCYKTQYNPNMFKYVAGRVNKNLCEVECLGKPYDKKQGWNMGYQCKFHETMKDCEASIVNAQGTTNFPAVCGGGYDYEYNWCSSVRSENNNVMKLKRTAEVDEDESQCDYNENWSCYDGKVPIRYNQDKCAVECLSTDGLNCLKSMNNRMCEDSIGTAAHMSIITCGEPEAEDTIGEMGYRIIPAKTSMQKWCEDTKNMLSRRQGKLDAVNHKTLEDAKEQIAITYKLQKAAKKTMKEARRDARKAEEKLIDVHADHISAQEMQKYHESKLVALKEKVSVMASKVSKKITKAADSTRLSHVTNKEIQHAIKHAKHKLSKVQKKLERKKRKVDKLVQKIHATKQAMHDARAAKKAALKASQTNTKEYIKAKKAVRKALAQKREAALAIRATEAHRVASTERWASRRRQYFQDANMRLNKYSLKVYYAANKWRKLKGFKP